MSGCGSGSEKDLRLGLGWLMVVERKKWRRKDCWKWKWKRRVRRVEEEKDEWEWSKLREV